MKALFRLALWAALVAPFAISAIEPTTGRVLLIDYDRVLEGDIERVGNQFRVRQPGAGEMTIPATKTMVLVADREAAYHLVKARTKSNDPVERARLARWCLTNQFKARAVAEAEAALALLPDDRSLKRFVDEVKLLAALSPPPSVSGPKPAPKLLAPEPAVVEASPESFSLFATRVQPLLMNACAQCHAGEGGGTFKLTRTAATFGDKRATLLNLAAASSFLNREQPSSSPLLVRAVSAHGQGAQPPLRDRQAPAFKYLEEWARLTTGKSLTPAPAAPPAALPDEAVAGAQPLTPELPASAKKTPPVVVLPMKNADGVVSRAKLTEPAAAGPVEKAEPSDPFDPILFNKPQPKKP